MKINQEQHILEQHVLNIMLHLGLTCDGHYYVNNVKRLSEGNSSIIKSLSADVCRVSDNKSIAKLDASLKADNSGFEVSLSPKSFHHGDINSLKAYLANNDLGQSPADFMMGLAYTAMTMEDIRNKATKAILYISKDHNTREYGVSPIQGLSNDKIVDARIRDSYPSAEFLKKHNAVASINGNLSAIEKALKNPPRYSLSMAISEMGDGFLMH